MRFRLRLGGSKKDFTCGFPVLGSSTNNPDGDWAYHDVVVKDGRVYDSFTGSGGLPPEEYMNQFRYAEDISFPSEGIIPEVP
jgi:hypothetical protein